MLNNSFLNKRLKIFLTICLFLIALPALIWAAEFTAFGPQNYVRQTGTPITVVNNFSVLNPNTEFILRIYNGGLQDSGTELVSSSIISINGKQVVGPERFNQQVMLIEVPVILQSSNTLEVEVRGKPGGLLIIYIIGKDNVAPNIQIIDPLDGSVTDINSYEIKLSFSDDISGVNPSSFKISINDDDKTKFFTITATGLSGSASGTVLLFEGNNTINASISDFAGNASSSSATVTLQALLEVKAKANPDIGYAPLPVSFSADTLGNIILYEWDFDGDGTYDWSSTISPNTTYTYMAVGTYLAKIRVTDSANNTQTDTVTITVNKPLVAIPRAAPTSGVRPLIVFFYPGGTDATGTIIKYEWDYNGDGKWDWTSPLPDISNRTYNLAGTYNAVLKVTDNNGLSDTAVITIIVTNPSPTVTNSATPTNGPIPLTVSFSGSASSPNGAITKYEWDFEGNGTYDWSSSTSASTSHTYNSVGTYSATLKVTDVIGQSATAVIIIRPQPLGSPTVTVSAKPTMGNSPLTVNFSGTASSPNGAIAKYEWDFNNDGVFDWSSTTTGNTSYTYNTGGIFDATLRVTDEANIQGIGSVRISVNVIISLTRNPDSFNPTNHETTTVTTVYSGAAKINILVKDRMKATIRNLISGEYRTAGTYNDVWDGRDDNGEIVSDDSYYFVAEAMMPGGLVLVYDITGTGITGTRRSIGGYSASFPSTFAPYKDQFCIIGYNVPVAGEVTADICPYSYYGERIKALIGREPQSRGYHTVIWDGTNDQGQMVSGGLWLVTIWSYDLSANGVVVYGSRPLISNVSAEPNYLDPSYHADEPVGYRPTTVTYTLSKNADVMLKVYDLNNVLIRTVTQTNVPAGINTITWDGRNSSGNLVTAGQYKLGIKATDSEGNESITMYAHVVVFY